MLNTCVNASPTSVSNLPMGLISILAQPHLQYYLHVWLHTCTAFAGGMGIPSNREAWPVRYTQTPGCNKKPVLSPLNLRKVCLKISIPFAIIQGAVSTGWQPKASWHSVPFYIHTQFRSAYTSASQAPIIH